MPVTDLNRAEKFYGDLFGYTFARQEEKMGVTMSWFPMIGGEEAMKTYGAAGTLIKGGGFTPSHDCMSSNKMGHEGWIINGDFPT
ncbi:MAG: hypothetical protein DWG76_05290 [Chloroflexi bacterium]|nr:hypothetical protein [Chloroflexota bacterium]